MELQNIGDDVMYKQKLCTLWAIGFVIIILSACSTSVISEGQTESSLEVIRNTECENLASERDVPVTEKHESQSSSKKTAGNKISSNTNSAINLEIKENTLGSRPASRDDNKNQKQSTYNRSEKENYTNIHIAENNNEIQESDTGYAEPTAAPKAFDMGDDYKTNILDGINSYRKSSLAMDQNLSEIAQSHAMKMALQKKAWHECTGIESVAAGAYRDGFLQGTILTIHCSDLAEDKVKRIGVGAAKDENRSIYVCVYAKTY